MSDIIFEEQKCAVCGHINNVAVTISYTANNKERSLDFRLGGMERFMFYDHLKACEKCHYVNTELNKLIPALDKNIVKSQKYQQLFKQEIDIDTILLAGYRLYSSVKDYKNAGYCMLACSWYYDDYNDKLLALGFREMAKIELEKYLESNPNDQDYSTILVDIYRRTQNFDKASNLAFDLLKKTDNETMKKLLLFQIFLCMNKDYDKHYIKEIK